MENKEEIDQHELNNIASNKINIGVSSGLAKTLGEGNINSSLKQSELSNSSEETSYNKTILKKRLFSEMIKCKDLQFSPKRICGKNYLNSKIIINQLSKPNYFKYNCDEGSQK